MIPPLTFDPRSLSSDHHLLRSLNQTAPTSLGDALRRIRRIYPEFTRLGEGGNPTPAARNAWHRISQESWTEIVRHGDAVGLVLTEDGAARLEWLWLHEVIRPYVSRIQHEHGEELAKLAAAQHARPDLKALAQVARERRSRATVATRLLHDAVDQDSKLLPHVPIVESQWSESDHQMRLFEWAAEVAPELPAVVHLAHIPNGGYRPHEVGRRGQSYSRAGVNLKFEGVRPGYPDLTLDVPAGLFHGLRIELKKIGGELRPDQKAWLLALRAQGYCADKAEGWRDARILVLEYLSGIEPPLRWVPKAGKFYELPPLPNVLKLKKKRLR